MRGPSFPAGMVSLLASFTQPQTPQPPTYGYKLLAAHPHDMSAFTQGLCYEPDSGMLIESTGLYGESTIRRVQIETGRVREQDLLPDRWFGEGVTRMGDTCVQLLWREGICLVRNAQTLELESVASLPQTMNEGWGLTHDGEGCLYASDGSDSIHCCALVRDDGGNAALVVTRKFSVTSGGLPLYNVNELQWVRGELWANIWREDRIAVIEPTTGAVRCFVDLSDLLTAREREQVITTGEEVLNGIAYDEDRNRLFVTGKCWPTLFEIAGPAESPIDDTVPPQQPPLPTDADGGL